jgi:hypothetical protein
VEGSSYEVYSRPGVDERARTLGCMYRLMHPNARLNVKLLHHREGGGSGLGYPINRDPLRENVPRFLNFAGMDAS